MIAGACFGDRGGSPDAGSEDRVDARPPHRPSTRFDVVAENRRVPASGLGDGFGAYGAYGGVRFWATLDLDGDGFLDIVHTGDTAVTQRVWDAGGSPHWKVFAGDAMGWSSTVTTWPVPPSGRAEGFFAWTATGGGNEWATIDIDGDRRMDLVHTMDPATGRVWDAAGAAHWKVYPGQMPAGFATVAVAWRVPDSGTSTGFASTQSNNGTAQWVLLDMTGDGRRDLVQPMDPVTGRVWDAAGAPHWKVFENTDAGFATQPLLWTVPSSGTENGFRVSDMDWYGEQWVTVDIDADDTPDLVQTADPATQTVWDATGAPYWKVFRGGASGFAMTSESWRVPPSGLPDGFVQARSDRDQRRWGLIDLDGDGDRDLVQTGDTSHAARVWDATGAPYWKVFVNDRDSFSRELLRWTVPRWDPNGFWSLTNGSGNLFWFVGDTDDDGHPDLVHTMDPATSAVWDATGSAYWKVYRGLP